MNAFLHGIGLGPLQARSVVQALGPDCEARVRADPYLVSEAVSGMGFKTADRIARSLGIEGEAPARLRAGLRQALRDSLNDGHSGLPRARVCETAAELLGAPEPSPALAEQLVHVRAEQHLAAALLDGRDECVRHRLRAAARVRAGAGAAGRMALHAVRARRRRRRRHRGGAR